MALAVGVHLEALANRTSNAIDQDQLVTHHLLQAGQRLLLVVHSERSSSSSTAGSGLTMISSSGLSAA